MAAPKPITCWGEVFPSIQALADDPRCVVSVHVLGPRLKNDWTPEAAAETPASEHSKPITCWGEVFPSIQAWSMDPRCVVSVNVLRQRLKKNWTPEAAAESPASEHSKPITCWGEVFPSIQDLAKDPRCVVSKYVLRERLSEGWTPEAASETPDSDADKPITCWGEEFPSIQAWSMDPRCVVGVKALRTRLKQDWTPEAAAETPAIGTSKPITCWGEVFPSIRAWSMDPRCVVKVYLLRTRLQENWTPEAAAETPVSHNGKPITCWGEVFPSIQAWSMDPRCVVSVNVLRQRLSEGWTPEAAAESPAYRNTITTATRSAAAEAVTAELVELVRSLGEHVHELPLNCWLAILRQSKILDNLPDGRITGELKLQLLQGEITPAGIVPLGDAPADEQKSEGQEPMLTPLQQVIEDLKQQGHLQPDLEPAPPAAIQQHEDSEERRQQLIALDTQDILRGLGDACRVCTDATTVRFLIREATERLWRKVLGADNYEAAALEVLAAAAPTVWASEVRNTFLADWQLIAQLGDVPGFVPPQGFRLNLMQRREAALLKRDRARLNISGMGAGKTLAALAGVHCAGCERVLVLCPNNAITSWTTPLGEMFPSVSLSTKSWEPYWMEEDSPRFVICNHEMLADASLQKLEAFVSAFQPDAVVIDELHLCKRRTNFAESQRHRNLTALLDLLRSSAVIYGLTGTPVVNELAEAIALLELIKPEAAEGLKSEHTVNNCLAVHEALQPLTSRYVPPQPCAVVDEIVEVAADAWIEDVTSACAVSVNRGEQALLEAKLPALVELCSRPGKTVVFTSAVAGIVEPTQLALQAMGLKTVVHTGEVKEDAGQASVDRFLQDSTVRVLLASSGTLATGFDGLQRVCGRAVFLTLPWTAAEMDQAKHRLIRQGTAFEQVELIELHAVLDDPETGEPWSLDRQKSERLRNKRTVSAAVTDGIVPEQAQLTVTETSIRKAAERWARNLTTRTETLAAA